MGNVSYQLLRLFEKIHVSFDSNHHEQKKRMRAFFFIKLNKQEPT